jgi:hypothetical protein
MCSDLSQPDNRTMGYLWPSRRRLGQLGVSFNQLGQLCFLITTLAAATEMEYTQLICASMLPTSTESVCSEGCGLPRFSRYQ